jgi:hypothetical protein
VIVSDPEALEPERMNSMDKGPIASMFIGIPPKSARVNDIKPDEPDIVFSTAKLAASVKRMMHLRVPLRVEAKLKSSEVKFVKSG